MAKKLFHVVAAGYHPHNTWERREDGLYELAGSVYAFNGDQLKACTQTEQVYRDCRCWDTPDGHQCPKADCISV